MIFYKHNLCVYFCQIYIVSDLTLKINNLASFCKWIIYYTSEFHQRSSHSHVTAVSCYLLLLLIIIIVFDFRVKNIICIIIPIFYNKIHNFKCS